MMEREGSEEMAMLLLLTYDTHAHTQEPLAQARYGFENTTKRKEEGRRVEGSSSGALFITERRVVAYTGPMLCRTQPILRPKEVVLHRAQTSHHSQKKRTW